MGESKREKEGNASTWKERGKRRKCDKNVSINFDIATMEMM